ALKVVLAHRPCKRFDWRRDQRIFLAQLSERQMECLFVPVEILIIEIRVLVEPKRQAKRLPAALLMHQNLPRFKFVFARLRRTATAPDDPGLLVLRIIVVRPEDRSCLPELLALEQRFRIHDRHVIGIKEEDLAEPGVQDRIRLEFPTFKPSRGKLFTDIESFDASDSERLEQTAHRAIHLLLAQIPELNRQSAPKIAQQIDAYPGAGEITHTSTANHDSASVKTHGGIRFYAFDELLAGHSGALQIQRLFVVIILSAGQHAALNGRPLA